MWRLRIASHRRLKKQLCYRTAVRAFSALLASCNVNSLPVFISAEESKSTPPQPTPPFDFNGLSRIQQWARCLYTLIPSQISEFVYAKFYAKTRDSIAVTEFAFSRRTKPMNSAIAQACECASCSGQNPETLRLTWRFPVIDALYLLWTD